MVKYEAHVTGIGPLVGEFTQAGILVLFRQGAPDEVAEFAILHDGDLLHAPAVAGDWLWLGPAQFRLLAVGDVANTNLAALGHLVLKFNGQTAPELPGDVCLEAGPLPDVTVGMRLLIADSADGH